MRTYEPLNTLKPVAPDVWIVDGPAVRFGAGPLSMPFPTRCTILRLPGDRLFVHSPTPLTDRLGREVSAIGEPTWLIGPSRLHHLWLAAWQAAFPAAEVRVAARSPAVAGPAPRPLPEALSGEAEPWRDTVDTLPIRSRFFSEVEFFHRPTRTLVLTDLIENFEPAKLGGRFEQWLARAGRACDPDGQMPKDLRLAFIGRRRRLRNAVQTMIGWQPERVVLSHGRWYDRRGADELRRAFRWLLGDGRSG